jgi:hypothetical protein
VQIALVDGPPVLVTNRRLLQSGETFLQYSDVRYCDWIDRNQEVAARLRQSDFQKIVFELNDGRIVSLDGLGQAAFPQFKFFWFKLGRGRYTTRARGLRTFRDLPKM